MMLKRITIVASVCLVLMSCGPALISSLLKVNTGDAKRVGKVVLSDTVNSADLVDTRASTRLRDYIISAEGKAYFTSIRTEYGELEKLKLKGVKGSSSDTMNYRFLASFKNSKATQEVRVQAFEDKEIVNVLVGPWEEAMKPFEKVRP